MDIEHFVAALHLSLLRLLSFGIWTIWYLVFLE